MKQKTFEQIHYPRDPGRWAAEKGVLRLRAYALAEKNGPKMARVFHIRRQRSDQAYCGLSTIPDRDIDHDASAIAWTGTDGILNVVCPSCHENRLPASDPDQMDTMELIEMLEKSGLNVFALTENTDFSKLKFWDHFPTEGSKS